MREWFRHLPKFSLVGGLALGFTVFVFVFSVLRIEDVAVRNCEEIELVKARIRIVVHASLVTLGKPGTAGYGYYVSHPAELAQARKELRHELAEFAPKRC